MRRRSILLLTIAVMIIVIATVQVTPVSAAASISPDPTWNKLYNGDFEQGTYSLGDFGNCPNSWTQTNSYYDPSYRLTPHYDVIYETTHGNGHASPTDDNYRLQITASCAGDFWNNAWVEEGVYQDTGDHLITATTTFYGSIMLIYDGSTSEATSGAYRIKIYCHDDWNGYGTWVYLDYRLQETSGGYNYGESRTHKIIDLIMSQGCWEGVSDYPTGYTGRNLYQDVHNKFDSEGFSNYYYCRIYCAVWAKCVWLAGSYGTYAFDGARIGEYPTVVASSASPTETDSGSVDFTWTCDTPTCMFQNGYDGNYGALRGGVNSYRVYIDANNYASTTSTSTTYDFGGISKGRYTPYVTAQRVDNTYWGPSSSFSEVLNGYTLTVRTHWCASATGTATLSYAQHGSACTHDLKDTDTDYTVIVDPSSTTSVPTDVSYSAGNYRVHTYDTRSWTISASATYDVYYYKQYWSSIATSGLISSHPATMSVVQGGTTNNPTTYGTWSGWADYNSALSINSAVNVSATRRYHTPNTVSWTVNSYPFSKSVTYYCQWKPTVALVNTDILHSVGANYTVDGSPRTDSGCYTSWSKWVDNSTALSFSHETTGGFTTERWRAYGARSWTITSAITPTITYTHQYKCTISTGGLVSSYPATVTVYQGGVAYNPTTYGTWSGWADYNSALSINSAVNVSATERFHTPNAVSWTVTSALTPSMNYWREWKPTVTLSGTSSSHKVNATYTRDGSPATDLNAYSSWSNWIDNGASLAFSQTVTGSGATERWHTPTVSLTITDATTKTVTYFHEWKPTVSLYGLPNPSHSVNATYTQDGSPAWWNGYTGSWSDWVDSGAMLTFSFNSALSTSSARWHTYSVRGWAVSSAFSASITYIHQYYVSLDPRDEFGNPLGGTVSVQYTGDDGGDSSNGTFTTSFSAMWSRWMNAGSTLRNAKLASGSSQTDQWYSYDGALNGDWRERAVSLSATFTLTFYHQFRPEIELYTTQYGQKVYDNSWYLSPYDWIQASAYLTASDTHTPIVGTYTFTFTDPSSVPHAVDGSTKGSCFYQIPQARGAWMLCITWNDGSGVVFDRTVPFYVWDYSAGFQSLVQSGNNLNLTVYVNQLSGATSTTQDYGYMIALTGGSGSGIYTNVTGFTFGTGFMQASVSSISTRFFFSAGMWVWSAHMINVDPYLAHVVGVRVLVVDPITGYVYANTTSTKILSIGGEGDLQIQFNANPNWYKHGLFRVYYTFLLYDVSGGTLLASKTVDYGNSSPLSWIMRGTGEGEIKTVYYFTGLHNSTTLTQIPVSLLAPYTTARLYLAFEDSHALSTQSQVSPAAMHYMNITFAGGDVFATGCVPPSTWVAEGNITLSVDSPFYPKPPYYSSTTRFMFLGWKWTYTSSYPQWASCNSTTLIIDVTQPIQVVAYWRTQYLIEYTPYVPTTAPTDTVEVSYTANATLTTMSVKSATIVRVWADAYTFFTMNDLWVNDYTWYGVNYDTPSKNVTGGASLTLPYVEKINKVSNTTIESNNFEAGGTLSLNLTLTTTYFNAQWINVTVIVASENAVLVDRNGATWSNMRIQLQNNTALITIPLPADIGNGTLMVILTTYGKVEPTTKQVTLQSPSAPPGQGQQQGGVDSMPIAVTVTSLGGLLGASLLIRKWRRADRQRSGRITSNATATTTTTAAATGSDWVPIINSLSGAGIIEFHEQRGPHLKTIIDRDSKFLSKLRGDPGMCVRHHGTRPLVIQDPEGEYVALLSYTARKEEEREEAGRATEDGRSRLRIVKNTLVLCSKEHSGADIMKLAEELSQLGNSRSIRLKLVSTARNRTPPPTRRNPSDSSSPIRHNSNHSQLSSQ